MYFNTLINSTPNIMLAILLFFNRIEYNIVFFFCIYKEIYLKLYKRLQTSGIVYLQLKFILKTNINILKLSGDFFFFQR